MYCQKFECENRMDIYSAKVKTIKYKGIKYDLILCEDCYNELERLEKGRWLSMEDKIKELPRILINSELELKINELVRAVNDLNKRVSDFEKIYGKSKRWLKMDLCYCHVSDCMEQCDINTMKIETIEYKGFHIDVFLCPKHYAELKEKDNQNKSHIRWQYWK